MPLFFDSPRYEWGVLGFFTTPHVGRRIHQIGGIASVLVLMTAGVIHLAGRDAPSVPAQVLFLVAAAWLVVFGFFRLFFTGAMGLFDAVGSLVEDAIPAAAVPLHFLHRAYWIFIELTLIAQFFGIIFAAGCIPFGVLSLLD